MTVKTKERQREGRLGRFMDDPQPRRQVPAARPQAQPPGPPQPAVRVAPVSEPEPEPPVKRVAVRRERGKWRKQKQEQQQKRDEVPAGLVYGVMLALVIVAIVAAIVQNCGCF